MKHIYRYLCVDLRGPKSTFIIYSPVSEEAGLLLLMRESFILYNILYKSICIQILCDNKGSACIVTALSFCIDTVLDVVKLCGFIQGLFSSIIVNSLLIRKSDKERLLMLCIMIACCEHFTNFVGSMQIFFCVQIIKLLFHYIFFFC